MTTISADLCSPWVGWDEVHRLSKYQALEEDDVAAFLMPASLLCYKLSGRRWPGRCTVTHLRPCRRSSGDTMLPRGPIGVVEELPGTGTSAYWGGWCRCGGFPARGDCGCPGWEPLDLSSFAPISEVTEVLVDGSPVTAFTLYEGRYIVRTDGKAWPSSQDLALDETAAGTFSISFEFGQDPPEDAQLACAMLAGELGLAYKPGQAGACTLPERVQTVTRQGMTFALLDPQTYLEGDRPRTGIYLIDLWLAATPGSPSGGATLSYPGAPTSVRRR